MSHVCCGSHTGRSSSVLRTTFTLLYCAVFLKSLPVVAFLFIHSWKKDETQERAPYAGVSAALKWGLSQVMCCWGRERRRCPGPRSALHHPVNSWPTAYSLFLPGVPNGQDPEHLIPALPVLPAPCFLDQDIGHNCGLHSLSVSFSGNPCLASLCEFRWR